MSVETIAAALKVQNNPTEGWSQEAHEAAAKIREDGGTKQEALDAAIQIDTGQHQFALREKSTAELNSVDNIKAGMKAQGWFPTTEGGDDDAS